MPIWRVCAAKGHCLAGGTALAYSRRFGRLKTRPAAAVCHQHSLFSSHCRLQQMPHLLIFSEVVVSQTPAADRAGSLLRVELSVAEWSCRHCCHCGSHRTLSGVRGEGGGGVHTPEVASAKLDIWKRTTWHGSGATQYLDNRFIQLLKCGPQLPQVAHTVQGVAGWVQGGGLGQGSLYRDM